MAEKQNLYFIAVIPPQDICDEITRFKEDFKSRFKSKAALRVVPHITLKAPFKVPAVYHEQIIKWFKQLPVTILSFQQDLDGFDVFDNKRSPVVYIKPVLNNPLLSLQQKIIENFRRVFAGEIMRTELDFKPHMTVAYRDLQPHLFIEAWKEYKEKEYTAAFEVDDFHLLQHDGRMWNTISTYSL